MKDREVNKDDAIVAIVQNLKTMDVVALVALITMLIEETSFRKFYYSSISRRTPEVSPKLQLIADTLDALLTNIGVFDLSEIKISLLDEDAIRRLLTYYIERKYRYEGL